MKNKNNVKKNNFFNDNSLIGIHKDVKISYIEKNKNKEQTNISINPLVFAIIDIWGKTATDSSHKLNDQTNPHKE